MGLNTSVRIAPMSLVLMRSSRFNNMQPGTLKAAFLFGILYNLTVPTISLGTAIVLIRTPTEIVVASDGKAILGTKAGDSSIATCKIHKLKSAIYFVIAGASDDTMFGGSYNIANEIQKSASTKYSMTETVEAAKPAIETALVKHLTNRRDRNVEYFRSNFYRMRLIEIAFFSTVGEVPRVHKMTFRAHEEPTGIRVEFHQEECPGNCTTPERAVYFVGEAKAMQNYVSRTSFDRHEQLTTTAEKILNIAIEANPQAIGPPVAVVRVHGQTASWIKSGHCESISP